MSEPSREHVEAVARFLNDDLGCGNFYNGGCWDEEISDETRGEVRADAETLLTSTEPAVLDAMQDALVRAGRLTDALEWMFIPGEADTLMRRLVTEWTEAPE